MGKKEKEKKEKHINATLAICGSPGRPDRDVRRLHGALRPARLLLPVLFVLLLFCQYEFERPVSSTQHSAEGGLQVTAAHPVPALLRLLQQLYQVNNS